MRRGQLGPKLWVVMGLEQPMTFQDGERVWEDRADSKLHSTAPRNDPFAALDFLSFSLLRS